MGDELFASDNEEAKQLSMLDKKVIK